MSNTVKFIILGILLFGGFYFLINSEYSSAKLDTLQKWVAGVLFATFIVGIFYGLKKSTKG